LWQAGHAVDKNRTLAALAEPLPDSGLARCGCALWFDARRGILIFAFLL
jgi:hypothetical protein